MYLTSFVNREDLFSVAERWLCGWLDPNDGLRITQILICDGFVVWETLEALTNLVLEMIHEKPFQKRRIRFKGELRDAIARSARGSTTRVRELINLYENNPDFFFREVPVYGVMCVDERECLLGFYRIKRPRRIAEKANRHIAGWIFKMVQDKAQEMAESRAMKHGIPLNRLLTPKNEMVLEFIKAEEAIADMFKQGRIQLDRHAMTIHDVGGIKLIVDEEILLDLHNKLSSHPMVRVLNTENHWGNYRDTSYVLEVLWDKEKVCRKFRDGHVWKRYFNRGIEEELLKKGLEPFLENAKPTLNIELILCTLPDMVESELGNSIHEERIMSQRDNKDYKGYIPMNVEFLIEYLFAVGFSPRIDIDALPIKLWGRYLPDTVACHIRRLYNIPQYEFFF